MRLNKCKLFIIKSIVIFVIELTKMFAEVAALVPQSFTTRTANVGKDAQNDPLPTKSNAYEWNNHRK